MPTPDEVTKHLQLIVENCKKVLDWAGADAVSSRMIKDDVTHLHLRKQEILSEIDELQKRKDGMLQSAQDEIIRAKAEAERIMAMARENLVQAAKNSEKVKEDLKQAEQAKYMAEKKIKTLLKD